MKTRIMISCAMAALLGIAATSVMAQNGPGPRGNGRGYGGPPQSEEERAARQANCPQPENCQQGKGQQHRGYGWGNGNGQRHGLRDGTGPRNAGGNCPLNTPAQPKR